MFRHRGIVVALVVFCFCLLSGAVIVSVAASSPLVAQSTGDTGAAADTVQVSFSVENTGPEQMVGVTLQLSNIPEGFRIAETGGDGAYGSQGQAFIYLTIGSGESVTSTVTFQVSGCIGRGTYTIGADVINRDSQTVDSTNSTVTITRNRDPDRQPLGPNGRRNCVVDPSEPTSFPRDCIQGESPAVVYTDEQLNVSEVIQSETQTPIGTDDVVFTGIGGRAEDDVQSVSDPTNVNFQSFETGLYSTDDTGDNATAEVIVRDPEVRSLEIYTEPGQRGAEVSGGQIVRGFPVVYVNPQYNFDRADRLELSVYDTEDVEVTKEVLASNEDEYITRSGQDITLDFSNTSTEQYDIDVEGTTMCPTASTTLDITNNRLSVEGPSEPVTRGEFITVNVSSQPQTTAHVRLPADRVIANQDEVTTSQQRIVAEQLFTNAGGVSDRFYDPQTDQYVATIDEIDDDGTSQLQLRTDSLRTGQLTIGAGPGSEPTEAPTDSIDIEITEAEVTIDQKPTTIQAREEFAIRGQAEASDQAAAYVRIDGTWRRVPGSDAPTTVNDGQYVLNLSAEGPLAIPGRYPLAVVSNAIVENETFPDTITSAEWRELDTTTTSIIRVQSPSLTVSAANTELAKGTTDEIEIHGQTVGDDVRIYTVSPTGEVTVTPEDVDGGQFEHQFEGGKLGTHRLVIVSPGRDGNFASAPPQIPQSTSASQSIARLMDAHNGSGVDDLIVTQPIRVATPRLTTEAVWVNDTIQIRGQTNRANETAVLIDVRHQRGEALYLANTQVSNGSFDMAVPASALNSSALEENNTINADSAAVRQFNVTVTIGELQRSVSVTNTTSSTPASATPTVQTPSATSTATQSETPTPTPVSNSSRTPVSTPTPQASSTTGNGSGFAWIVGLIAFVLVILAARRQHTN